MILVKHRVPLLIIVLFILAICWLGFLFVTSLFDGYSKESGKRFSAIEPSKRSIKPGLHRNVQKSFGAEANLWKNIDADFKEFQGEFPSYFGKPILLSETRSNLKRCMLFQFWEGQLDSKDPKRVDKAKEIFLLSPTLSVPRLSTDADPLSEMLNLDALPDSREGQVAQGISDTLRLGRMFLDNEREKITAGIERGLYPPDVRASGLPSFVYPGNSSEETRNTPEYKDTQNSDYLIMSDASKFVEHFVPELKSANIDEQEKILGILNGVTYGLYEEDGAEFWLDVLDNLDNLGEFFGE